MVLNAIPIELASEKTVIQYIAINEDILKEWQMVLSKRLSKKDLQRAKKSKVLRVQELEQMRTDNVLIRVGDLAGERLADVLMRDLMEVA